MNEKRPKTLTEEAPTTDLETHDLFDALMKGEPITSQNVTMTDQTTGESVSLWKRKRGTMVMASDRMGFIKGGTLTMKPQEEKEGFSLISTDTTSALVYVEEDDDYINLRHVPSSGLARILARAPKSLERALAWEEEHGPVLDNLDKAAKEIFGDIDLSPEEWETIRDAPYDPY